MSQIWLPNQSITQPQYSAQIAPPFQNSFWYGFNAAAGIIPGGRGGASPTLPFFNGGVITGSEGKELYSTAAVLLDANVDHIFPVGTSCTVVVIPIVPAESANPVFDDTGTGSSEVNFFFYTDSKTYWRWGDDTVAQLNFANVSGTLNSTAAWVLDAGPAGLRAYRNGVLVGANSAAHNARSGNSGQSAYICGSNNGATPMSCALFVTLAEQFPDNVARSLSANPWQLFKAPPRRIGAVSGTAVTIDSIVRSDWQSSFLNDRQIQSDFIAAQQINKAMGSEWGQNVLKDSAISSEVLASANQDARLESDWISSLKLDRIIAQESLAQLSADERATVELLASMQNDSAISADHLANLLTDFPIPVDHVVAFLTDRPITLDFASSVAASHGLSSCWMMLQQNDSSVPAEWQGTTSPFDTGVTHIFRVDARGTVFVITQRDADFSIAPRSTIFNILN